MNEHMADNLRGEFIDDEVCATHLQINVYPVTPESGGPFGTDEFEEIMDLVEEEGFSISSESYHQTIVTSAFVTTEDNIGSMKFIASKIAEKYPENEVKATIHLGGGSDIVGGEFFGKIQMITVEENR